MEPEPKTSDPCGRCKLYEKELKTKDKTILELQVKLGVIHQMATNCEAKDKQEGPKINITKVNVGFTSSLSCDGPSQKMADSPSHHVPTGSQQEKVHTIRAVGHNGEVSLTIQEIIDKVIDCSPQKNSDRLMESRKDDRLRTLFIELEKDLGNLGSLSGKKDSAGYERHATHKSGKSKESLLKKGKTSPTNRSNCFSFSNNTRCSRKKHSSDTQLNKQKSSKKKYHTRKNLFSYNLPRSNSVHSSAFGENSLEILPHKQNGGIERRTRCPCPTCIQRFSESMKMYQMRSNMQEKNINPNPRSDLQDADDMFEDIPDAILKRLPKDTEISFVF